MGDGCECSCAGDDDDDTVSGIRAADGLRESGGCARGVPARAEAAGAGTKLRSIAHVARPAGRCALHCWKSRGAHQSRASGLPARATAFLDHSVRAPRPNRRSSLSMLSLQSMFRNAIVPRASVWGCDSLSMQRGGHLPRGRPPSYNMARHNSRSERSWRSATPSCSDMSCVILRS